MTFPKAPIDPGGKLKTIVTDGESLFQSQASQAATGFTLGTPVSTSSGSSALFSGISGAKLVVVSFDVVSTTGVQDIRIRLGDSSGLKLSGYTGRAGWFSSGGQSVIDQTDGFGIHGHGATSSMSGNLTLSLLDADNNIWSASGGWAFTLLQFTTGSVVLPGELTQIDVQTQGGDTFDAGSINIMYI